jgi:hypothetical protein
LKKALIITYYWPPSGGAGVQRWLKFSKYMPQFGWQPIIYTPENGELPVTDQSLFKEISSETVVLKTPIWEPYDIYKKIIGQDKNEKINTGFLTENKKPKLAEKISVWLRGNLFIPDARKYWIKPSVKYLEKYLNKNPVDVIISTGPPHSMHLIARKIKEKTGIPWLADFRDPWTGIDFYEDLMLTRWANQKHHQLEADVLQNADKIIVVGDTMKKEFLEIISKTASVKESKISVITNGYDEQDYYEGENKLDKKFSLAHIGTLVRSRNAPELWQVLKQLCAENESFAADLEIKTVGKVDIAVMESIAEAGLMKYLKKTDYLPHTDVIKYQQSSQVLLLLTNRTKNAKGILTGKFFEYLAAKRPIIAIGDNEGDVAKIINETNAGLLSGFNEIDILKKNILGYYQQYKKGNLNINSKEFEKYSRKQLAAELVNNLNNITNS